MSALGKSKTDFEDFRMKFGKYMGRFIVLFKFSSVVNFQQMLTPVSIIDFGREVRAD